MCWRSILTYFCVGQPVDPTEYQNEWLGDVVSLCFDLTDKWLHATLVVLNLTSMIVKQVDFL